MQACSLAPDHLDYRSSASFELFWLCMILPHDVDTPTRIVKLFSTLSLGNLTKPFKQRYELETRPYAATDAKRKRAY